MIAMKPIAGAALSTDKKDPPAEILIRETRGVVKGLQGGRQVLLRPQSDHGTPCAHHQMWK